MQHADNVLRSAVAECQRWRAIYSYAGDASQRANHQAAIVQLFEQLQADLQTIAARWLPTSGRDTETLVANMFTNIFLGLGPIDAEVPQLRQQLLAVGVGGVHAYSAANFTQDAQVGALGPLTPSAEQPHAPDDSTLSHTDTEERGSWPAGSGLTCERSRMCYGHSVQDRGAGQRRSSLSTVIHRRIGMGRISELKEQLRLYQHPIGQIDCPQPSEGGVGRAGPSGILQLGGALT